MRSSKSFKQVGMTKKDGFRDYTILHLLDDSGARASEIATLKLDYFDPQNAILGILGKGDRYRQITLKPQNCSAHQTLYCQIPYHTQTAIPALFIYQSTPKPILPATAFTVSVKNIFISALSQKRLKDINPVHSFRHGCAVRMLCLQQITVGYQKPPGT